MPQGQNGEGKNSGSVVRSEWSESREKSDFDKALWTLGLSHAGKLRYIITPASVRFVGAESETPEATKQRNS